MGNHRIDHERWFALDRCVLPARSRAFGYLPAGSCMVLECFGVFLRDIAQLTLVITQALMFLSPVLYPLDKLPTWALQLLMLNPLTFIVNQVREILIYGNMPDFQGLLIYAVAAFIVCVLGLRFFRVVRHGFADVL